jgi:hypothetical protein
VSDVPLRIRLVMAVMFAAGVATGLAGTLIEVGVFGGLAVASAVLLILLAHHETRRVECEESVNAQD